MAKNKKPSKLITERLKTYERATDRDLLNAAKEIVQEIALLGLSRQGFFKDAAFQGGTALRIFYGLDRFSEDLYFTLDFPDPNYSFKKVLDPLRNEAESWGLELEVIERSKVDENIKKAFIKETSLGAHVNFNLPLPKNQKLTIKIEVDTNPPPGAKFVSMLCDFPTDFYVRTHDESSLFSGKLHAILCRNYLKGRDWYDLAFYLSRRSSPNFAYLQYALKQSGPYSQSILPANVDFSWLNKQLTQKIREVDFTALKRDVEPFVRNTNVVELWSEEYFLEKLKKWIELKGAG